MSFFLEGCGVDDGDVVFVVYCYLDFFVVMGEEGFVW